MRKAISLLFLVASVTACVVDGQGLGADGSVPEVDAMGEDASTPPPDAPPPDAPPGAPTLVVTATPMEINLGGSATINWLSTNTANCTSMGMSQPVNGTYTVSPTVDTTYTVVCTGLNGVGIMDHVDVTVIQPPPPPDPTLEVTATPMTISRGQSATVVWTSTNMSSCTNSETWSQMPNGTFVVSPIQTTAYTVVCTGLDGHGYNGSVTVTVIQPPLPTLDVTATSTSITVGQSTTVSWNSENATNCLSLNASGYWVPQPIDGSWPGLMPTTTTTYSLTCYNSSYDVVTGSVTVVVNAAPPPPLPTLTVTASPATINVGGTTTVTWTSANATSCRSLNSSGNWVTQPLSGSWTNLMPTSTTTYSLTCEGPGGSITRGALVTVNPLLTLNFSASPSTIDAGDSSCLSWASTNTTSCTIESVSKPTSGTMTVSPNATKTYTATCNGPGGQQITRTATVTVVQHPLPTLSFSATPATITMGQSSTLSWSTANATSCTATGSWSGSKPVNGTLVVSPTSDAKYQLSCTGPGGSVNATADVTVTAPQLPDLALTLTATPVAVQLGGGYKLEWDSTHADACTASNAWTGDRPVDGNIIVNPTMIATHTYTLTCTRVAGGTITKFVNISVTAPPANTMCHGMEAFYKNSDLPSIDVCKGWSATGVPQVLTLVGNKVSGPDGVCAITCHYASFLTVMPVGGSSIWTPGAVQDSARRYTTGCSLLPGHATDANPPSGITWDLQCATPVTVLTGPPNTNL